MTGSPLDRLGCWLYLCYFTEDDDHCSLGASRSFVMGDGLDKFSDISKVFVSYLIKWYKDCSDDKRCCYPCC